MSEKSPMLWPEALRRYFESWTATFGQILQQLSAAEGSAILVADAAESARAGDAARSGLTARLDCSGKLAGRQRMTVSAGDAAILGRILTGEPSEAPAELRDGERDAASELLRQVAGLAAGRLKEQAGGEVQFQERKEDPEDWKPVTTAAIRIERAADPPFYVVLEVDERLVASLDGGAPSPAAAAEPARKTDEPSPKEAANLNLLLDVELEASIRFGQKEILLKDVLALRPGTVVELARQVNEPAELLVAGKLMARGEVVVVEGNYGLRITEILGPAERMAAIRG